MKILTPRLPIFTESLLFFFFFFQIRSGIVAIIVKVELPFFPYFLVILLLFLVCTIWVFVSRKHFSLFLDELQLVFSKFKET